MYTHPYIYCPLQIRLDVRYFHSELVGFMEAASLRLHQIARFTVSQARMAAVAPGRSRDPNLKPYITTHMHGRLCILVCGTAFAPIFLTGSPFPDVGLLDVEIFTFVPKRKPGMSKINSKINSNSASRRKNK